MIAVIAPVLNLRQRSLLYHAASHLGRTAAQNCALKVQKATLSAENCKTRLYRQNR